MGIALWFRFREGFGVRIFLVFLVFYWRGLDLVLGLVCLESCFEKDGVGCVGMVVRRLDGLVMFVWVWAVDILCLFVVFGVSVCG